MLLIHHQSFLLFAPRLRTSRKQVCVHHQREILPPKTLERTMFLNTLRGKLKYLARTTQRLSNAKSKGRLAHIIGAQPTMMVRDSGVHTSLRPARLARNVPPIMIRKRILALKSQRLWSTPSRSIRTRIIPIDICGCPSVGSERLSRHSCSMHWQQP